MTFNKFWVLLAFVLLYFLFFENCIMCAVCKFIAWWKTILTPCQNILRTKKKYLSIFFRFSALAWKKSSREKIFKKKLCIWKVATFYECMSHVMGGLNWFKGYNVSVANFCKLFLQIVTDLSFCKRSSKSASSIWDKVRRMCLCVLLLKLLVVFFFFLCGHFGPPQRRKCRELPN